MVQISNWFVVRDLGSTNGVSINEQKIKKESRLQPGDQLTVGDVVFDFVEGDYDVPKGKVCIGPPLKSEKAKASRSPERRLKPGDLGRNFQGLSSGRDASTRDEEEEEEVKRPSKREAAPPIDEEAIAETFGSDADFDELDIEETFDSNSGKSGDPIRLAIEEPADEPTRKPRRRESTHVEEDAEPDGVNFDFLDDDDADEPEDEPRRPRRSRPQPYSPSRHPLASSGEIEEFDELEAEEPRRKQKIKAADQRLRREEQIDDENVEIRRVGNSGKSESMDSIIELDEFDLLD